MTAEARLLMLDEPALGLAPVVIEQIDAAIDGMHRLGLTILVVEKNISRKMLARIEASQLSYHALQAHCLPPIDIGKAKVR
jgi:ABC-type branched-subunit amino acid transport system ATPase component